MGIAHAGTGLSGAVVRYRSRWLNCRSLAMLLPVATALAMPTQRATAQDAAETFPSRPVTLIVPLAAGGAGDVEARLYCQKLSENTGKPCLVDYKPGAGTTIGTAYVAKSRPDGHTLLAVSPSITIAPALYRDLPYDVNRDFTPVTQMSKRATLIVATPGLPARNIAELVPYMRANPGKVNWGTVGQGSISHLLGAWLQMLTGTQMTIVHYKGSAPMNVDLIAGRIQASAYTFISATPLIKAGKIKALALSSAERSALLPDMPTVQEQGIPGFEYPSWLSIFGPAGIPPAVLARLHGELVRVAKAPEVARVLQADGTVMIGSSPEELRRIVAVEIERWKKLVASAGIKGEE